MAASALGFFRGAGSAWVVGLVCMFLALVSLMGMAETAHGALKPGFTLLAKPYTQRSLLEKVRSVLDAPVSAA